MQAIPPYALDSPRLQVGGNLREDALYIERSADNALFEALCAAEVSYVLAPRQMGKSSLCTRTVRRLSEEGACCVHLDLNRIGGAFSTPRPEQWFHSLLIELGRQLHLQRSVVEDFWEAHQSDTVAYRWARFLRDVILTHISKPLILVFDEIDTVLTLPFAIDDFFGVVRDAFNARDDAPIYLRLTFCFVGVATPSELMQDAVRTPFNIGTSIYLSDFTYEEARAFTPALRALSPVPFDAEELLAAILSWTAGHPYMTHKLCAELVRRVGVGLPPTLSALPSLVDGLVQELFLTRGRTEEMNLQYAEKRLDSEVNNARLAPLLRLYGHVIRGHSVASQPSAPLQAELRLCGLVRHQDGQLAVRNRIFASVYDLAWVQSKESVRFLDSALERWRRGGKRIQDLLRGQELADAQGWSRGRAAHDVLIDEHEFLLASLEAERNREARRAARNLVIAVLILTVGAVGGALYQVRANRYTVKLQLETAEARRKQALEAQARQKETELALANQLRLQTESRARKLAEEKQEAEQRLRVAKETELSTKLLLAKKSADQQQWEAERQTARVEFERNLHSKDLERLRAESLQSEVQQKLELAQQQQARDAFLLGLQNAEHVVMTARATESLRADVLVSAVRVVSEALWLSCGDSRGASVRTSDFLQDSLLQAARRVQGITLPHMVRGLYVHAPVRSAAFLPEGSGVVFGHDDGNVSVYSFPQLKQRLRFSAHLSGVTSVAASPDGKLLLTTGADGRTTLWKADTGSFHLDLTDRTETARSRFSAAVSPQGSLVASAGIGSAVTVWDLRRLLSSLWAKGARMPLAVSELRDEGKAQTVGWFSVSFSADGSRLAAARGDGTMLIWRLADSEIEHSFRANRGVVRVLAFSPNGRSLASGGSDSAVRLRNGLTGAQHWQALGGQGTVDVLAFSAEGRWLASGTENGSVQLLDAATGRLVLETKMHTKNTSAALFMPHGSSEIVSASSADDRVRVFSVSLSSYLRVACAKLRKETATEAQQLAVAHYCTEIVAEDCRSVR